MRAAALSNMGSGYLAVKNDSTFVYTGSGTETTTRNLFMDNGAATISVSDATGSLTWNDASLKNQSFTKTGAGTLAIGGAFSGTASVRASGGTLRLTATNSSYTGTTTLVGGVLEVSKLAVGGVDSSIGASGTAAANLVFNGGALSYTGSGDTTNRAFTITSAPAINANGSGALTWNGASPTFTTANTAYQITLGGTSTADNTWGTVLADNGSGASSLRKNGTGKWVLTGANTFTGTVGIAAGTLELGSAGTLGSGSYAGAIANAGVLSVATSANQTLAGVVSGAGSLTKSGASRLTLSAVNTYGGSTAITSGTIEIAGTGQLGSGVYAGAIANDGVLEFTTSANQSLSGGMSGGGSLRKAGGGRLTLLGNNTYTGATTVDSGTLAVNGLVSSSAITVNAGGYLGGSGTTAGVALVGGVISPGNSPGTLTIGDLSWDATSSYDWELYDYLGAAGSTTGWDLINGTGALTVSGTGFTFNLLSMTGTNTRGPLPPERWSQTTSGTFRIANFTSISAPSGTWWNLNTAGFSPYSATLGTFSLDVQSSSIDLVYTHTPPSAYVWTVGSGTWSDGANWSTDPDTPEGNPEIVFAGAGGTSTNDIVSGTLTNQIASIPGLTFSGSASGSYAINGNAISLGSLGIVNQSASLQTVQNGLTLVASSLANADTASLTLSGTIDTAGYLFTVTGSSNTTLSGVVTGSGGLAKLGAGALTLAGASDYTGGTLITSGTVIVGDGGTNGVLPGNVTNNATLVFDRSDAASVAGSIGGTGSLTKLGGNTLTLSGSVGYTGITTISGGTLALANAANQTLSGVITGGGALQQAGAGTLTLTASNSYAGGTTITSGTLQLGSGGTSGSISGDVSNDGVLAFNRSDAITFAGVISGTGGVRQAGTGATTLTGTNSYTGRTTIASGTLVLGGAGQLGGGSYAGAIANAGVLSYASSANQTLSGTLSGVGSLIQSGGSVLTLTAANSYSGGTTLSAGTIRVGNSAALGTGTAKLNGGALSSDSATARSLTNVVSIGGDITLGSAVNTGLLTFTGGVDLAGSTRQLTMPSNVTISGTVTNGGLAKAGAGVLTLTAANSYSGGTTLSAGTIRIGGNAALGTGTVTLNGGVLSSDSGTGRAPTNALAIGGDVTLGDATNNGVLTFAGGVNLGNAVRQVTVASDVTMSGTLTNGGLTKAGAATLTLTGASNYTGATTISTGTLRFTGSGDIGSTSGVAIAAGAVFDWGRAAAVSRVFSGSGTILRSTVTGNATFSGASPSFEGSWLITAGYVGLTSDAVVGASSVGMTWSGGQTSGIFFSASGNTLASTRTITLSGAGGALNGSSGNTNTFASVFTGTGTLFKVSGERAILTGVSDFTGGIDISGGGTLEIGGSGKFGGSSGTYNGSIVNANTIQFSTSADQTLGGVISGAGALVKSGAGTLTVTNASTYTGVTTISGGTFVIPTGGSLYSTGNFFGNAQTYVTVSNSATLVTRNWGYSAGNAFNELRNNYYAVSLLTGGTVRFTESSNSQRAFQVGAGGATLSVDSGVTYTKQAGTTGAENVIRFTADSALTITGSGNAVIADSLAPASYGNTGFSIAKTGAGALTLSGSNAFTGGVTLTNGRLNVNNARALGTGTFTVNGGSIDNTSGSALTLANANPQRWNGDFTFVGTNPLSLGAGAVTLAGDRQVTVTSSTLTVGGAIGGGFSLTKTGAGTLAFTSQQAFTGTATVAAGSLRLNAGNLLQAAARIDVLEGATLDATTAGLTVFGGQTLGGYGLVDAGAGALAFNSGAFLAPGGSVGELDGVGNATFNGGMTYIFEINDAGGTAGLSPGWDLFSTTGAITLVGGTSNRIIVDLTSLDGVSLGEAANFNPAYNYAWKFVVAGTSSPITTYDRDWFTVQTGNFSNGFDGNFYVARGDQMSNIGASGSSNELYVVYAAVPEPGTLALAGIGLATAAWAIRRQRRRTATEGTSTTR